MCTLVRIPVSRIFVEFYVWRILKTDVEIFQFPSSRAVLMNTLREKRGTRFSAFPKPTKYLFERRMLRMNGVAENETHSVAIYNFALSLTVSE